MEKNILKLGQEILIFDGRVNKPLGDYIRGTVVDYQDRKNGIYKVLGSDGKEYTGYYSKNPIICCTCFLTSKDYVNYLKSILISDDEKILEAFKKEEQESREAKKQVKRKLCNLNDHDPGEWKAIYYTGDDSQVHTKWTTKCKRCGEIITRETKPLEVLYKEIEEMSTRKK